MNARLKIVLYMMAAMVITLVCYIALHESGHMIVMLSAGATIDDFSITGAHVSSHGGEYTYAADMWLHANGAVLPLVMAYVYLLFYRKERKRTFYRIISFMMVLVPVFSLLAWVILPFAWLNGQGPAGDDVTQFLEGFAQTGSPLIVSGAAVLLMCIGLVLMFRKSVVKNYVMEIRELRNALKNQYSE